MMLLKNGFATNSTTKVVIMKYLISTMNNNSVILSLLT
jgi:hypothetical protein